MRWSARARITLGTVIVAAVLLTAALLLVRAQVATILSDADTSLARNDLVSFEKDITAHPDESVDDPGTGVLVYVRDPGGTVQVNTLPHDIVDIVKGEPATDERTFTDDEDRTYVVIGQSLSTPGGTWALWSARSTSSSELALAGFDRILLVGGFVLLLGFGVASWIIATLALRPVEAARAREKRMVSDAAHELRTPLASLKTQLELAHEDFGDADALADEVRAAEASVDRLASLASNLLELSRIESGDGSVVTGTLAKSLVDEFMGSVDRARMLATGTAVSVDFAVDVSDEGALYRIDPQSWGRLVDNLYSNAISAIHSTGVVSATLSQATGVLVLTVTDDGPGMPPEFLPIAFERFTRPDTSRGSSTGGSGLGLALVAAIAHNAGGTVTARNTNPGLQIAVTIPKM